MAYPHQVDTGLTGKDKALIGGYLFGVGVWLGAFLSAWKNQNKWLGAGLGAVAGAMGDHAMRRKAPVATVVGAGLGAAGVSLWPYPFEHTAWVPANSTDLGAFGQPGTGVAGEGVREYLDR